MEKIENEKIYKIILAIFTTFNISFIALFCFFCIGLSKVDASVYVELHDTNNNYVCSGSEIKNCNYGEMVNGNYVYKSLKDYVIIMEDLETLKQNNTYEIEIRWNLKTYALNNDSTDWITRNNYNTFSSTSQMNLSAGGGPLVDDSTKTWAMTSWALTGTPGTSSSYANYSYSYSNVFTPTYDLNRIVLRITKRDRWKSIGSYISFSGISPEIEITNITYTIKNISSSNQDVITNANQNTQDIINNNNNNTDKVINNQNQNQQQTNEGLQDIEDALTDDSSPNLDAFDDMSGWLPPGPLDSVLNIPLNILNGLVGAFSNNTCSPISIPIPFIGGTLDLPCLYNLYSSINGLSIALTTFFTAISGYLMFKYLSNLYVWIDKTLKMEESSYMQDWGGV